MVRIVTEPTARRPLAAYWQARVAQVLDQLEFEARRMLRLEQDLAEFSTLYYATVGEAAGRLARLEAMRTGAGNAPERDAAISELPPMDPPVAAPERSRELKNRYRHLAKEIHPDRAMVVGGSGRAAETMQAVNAAYRQGDLARMLRLEAEMEMTRMETHDQHGIENALHEVERAARTYGDAYRTMLGSPLNELMLRALSARLAGNDWMGAVVEKVERAIEQKERAMVEASIREIGQWRANVLGAA